MDQKLLKTTWKQRAVIIVIAVLMIFSFIATYTAILLSNNKSKDDSSNDNPETTALQEEYQKKYDEMTEYATKNLSGKYFDTLKGYKSRVKAYNATTANSDGLKTVDLKEGTGRELKADDTDYFAYYIGWCADESIFDSSFDSNEEPTTLKAPLSASVGLIEGWNQGVIGMKIGGVREITIPGELAYGDTQEICGGKNSPLKFVVLTVTDDKLKSLSSAADEVRDRLYAAYYGSSATSE